MSEFKLQLSGPSTRALSPQTTRIAMAKAMKAKKAAMKAMKSKKSMKSKNEGDEVEEVDGAVAVAVHGVSAQAHPVGWAA